MDIVVVSDDYFVTWILVIISALSALSKDTLYGLVIPQIASSVGCADNSSLTISVGWKL